MLIDLTAEFFAALAAPDPEAAYGDYLQRHRAVLSAYWHNYVLDLDTPPAREVIRHALAADHTDLKVLLASRDIPALVTEALARADELTGAERPTDCYLMVGVGAANAGELVVNGRGAIFVCLEHFTGRPNPSTYGMGLPAELLPLWVGHEVAHVVRYTAGDGQSELRRLIAEFGGNYDSGMTGSRGTLREHLVNEGLAVHAAQAVAPGLQAADYFGYVRRQHQRLRELEAFLRRAVEPDLDRAALGLRLRYLSGGMSAASRTINGKVLPERSGYYLGHRMTEAAVRTLGLDQALRLAAPDLEERDLSAAASA
ncbi:MAG TPA: DUF2268 domain-containing putative Zn-dependent protease [Gemmatimonadales bacterium]|nr:DUF2268 domain-containing putative Zn-dependent protease [Gemmatimonadales bacterium]